VYEHFNEKNQISVLTWYDRKREKEEKRETKTKKPEKKERERPFSSNVPKPIIMPLAISRRGSRGDNRSGKDEVGYIW